MEKFQTLKGFRDFLPKQMFIRNRVRKILTDVFESYGFEPIQTPALEYQEVLLGKYGSEADKLVYTFKDRGEREIGLRYDLTVPTARVVAQYAGSLQMPFKRYQIQPVWRAENTQKGRYREFEQCDADIIGSSSPRADAEILAVIFSGASRLGLGEFKIMLNSRPLLFDLMEKAGISDNVKKNAAISIDKLDKMEESEVKAEMIERRKIDKSSVDRLFEILKKLNDRYPDAQSLVEATELIEEVPADSFTKLQEIAKYALEMGVAPKSLIPQFSLARGLDYYTGAIYETVVVTPKIGSINGGGRYDRLIQTLGGPDIPAVGMSFGFDRICDVIEELNLWKDLPTSYTQVLVTVFSKNEELESIKIAKLLRESGVNAELYHDSVTKLEKQLKYADIKGVPWVTIVGPDEAKKKTLVLKNLKTKTQEEMPYSDIAARIR